MNITATATPDRVEGTLLVDLDIVGQSELDHELLAAFFASPVTVRIVPTHDGDELHAQFVIQDKAAFAVAVHNLDNRHRKADGRPSLEEEQAAADADAANKKQAEEDAVNAKANAEREAKERQDHIDELAAKDIADRVIAKEPNKVQ
jgi:hypothetical protein